ncbi:MAG: (d)CMP kinase [Paludibacteraceae bacterium]|nr:(d)CMP kinase [Paludibacteraceae bacterium]
MRKIIVAIDGYSSCGKSTVAKQLAQYAGYTYVDTGAMYRAVALAVSRAGVAGDEKQIIALLPQIKISFIQTSNGQHVCLNGEDVESHIRTIEIGNMASQVAVIGEVRRFLVNQQQELGEAKGIVMDGRDIGTVVFPNAELKLFLTARPEVRAQRRLLELQEKGEHPVYEDVLHDVNDRDYRDTHRAESPLRQAQDAIVVDNSDITKEEQMLQIQRLFDDCINRQ